jgi:PDZ domain-containing protein
MNVRSSRQFPSGRRRARVVAGLVLLLLAGCAQMRVTPPPGQPEGPAAEARRPRYEAVVGQDAATIARLRTSPPAEPEISQGTTPAGDERVLIGRGYVRIGNGYDAAGGAGARDWALQQGRSIGADKILLYAATPDSDLVAGYYVHYRLPFGARFRSLTADEQREVGASGVQIGEVVGGTPASEANLQSGDFVLKFNGKAITDRAAFQQMLSDHMGKRVTLTIRRGGVTMDRLVRLGAVAQPASDSRK